MRTLYLISFVQTLYIIYETLEIPCCKPFLCHILYIYSVSASRATCTACSHASLAFLWCFSCGRNHNEINFRFRRGATNATKVNCLIAALLNFIKMHMPLVTTRPRAYQWSSYLQLSLATSSPPLHCRWVADSQSELPLIDCTFASCSLRRA